MRPFRAGAVLGLAAAALALAAAAPAQDTEPPDLSTQLGAALAAWLDTLDEDQRDDARYAFDDSERFDLRLAPLGLEGLRRDAMDGAQWRALRAALDTVLSERGLRTVETIMSLEREVQRRDRESWLMGWFGRFVHGEGRYFASVYGDPAGGRPFGLRFDGHHLSLNWTGRPGRGAPSVTPLFLGAEPREVPDDWERGGLRALAEEEDAAATLWDALDAVQRAASELPFEYASGPAGGNRPLFHGEGPRLQTPVPRGVAHASLGPVARAALDALIDVWLSHFSEPIAAGRRAAIDAAGRDAIHFAWAGSLVSGEPGYYRVHGPGFLIEFDNTLETADHVHAVWRQHDGDFGRDLLAEHYAAHHAPHAGAESPRPLRPVPDGYSTQR